MSGKSKTLCYRCVAEHCRGIGSQLISRQTRNTWRTTRHQHIEEGAVPWSEDTVAEAVTLRATVVKRSTTILSMVIIKVTILNQTIAYVVYGGRTFHAMHVVTQCLPDMNRYYRGYIINYRFLPIGPDLTI
jgi:hypothetical protein